MPGLLRIDLAALSLSIVLAFALMITVGGSGIRRPLNRFFMLFTLAEAAWAILSLILRIALWFAAGNPQLLLEMATLAFSVTGPLFLLFVEAYVAMPRRWPSWVAAAVLALIAVFSLPLFSGALVSQPALDPAGATLYAISPLGMAVSALPGACFVLSIVLFAARRSEVREPFVALSAFLTLAGFAAGGLSRLRFPILSITNTVSVGILGWGIARRQLFNPLRQKAADLQARAERLELISQVGRRTTALLELSELLRQAVDLIQVTFSYFSVGIFLVEGGEIVLRASTLSALREQPGRLRLRLGQGITGTAAATGQPVYAPNVHGDPRYVTLTSEVKTNSELAIPILRGEKVIGVLDIQSTRVDGFSAADLATQQTIADQLSAAVENARLYSEARRRAERLALINRISAAVGAVLNLPDLLEAVRREVVPVFEADAFFIALYDPSSNELDFRIQEDEGRRYPPTREPVGTGLTSRVIRDRRPLLVNDAASPAGDLPSPEMWGTEKMPSSWMGVPILIRDRLIGVMNVQTYSPHLYTEEDTQLAATIADQVAVALENARLYEEVRRELAERDRTGRTLRESEEKFRNLAEQSPNMIFIWSPTRIAYANRQCELTLGFSREEFYDASFDFLSLIAPEDRGLMAENHARHLRGEEVAPCEYSARDRRGERLQIIITSKLLRYSGNPAILGIVTDITERKRSEELLQTLNGAGLDMARAMGPNEIFPILARRLGSVGYLSLVFFSDASKGRLRLSWYGSLRDGAVTVPESDGAWIDAGEVPLLAEALASRRTGIAVLESDRLADLCARGGVRIDAALGEQVRAIAAPLSVADDSFGVLAVAGSSLGDEHRQLITAFAHQAAAAWRKTTLMQDLEGSLAQLRKAQEQLLHAQKMEAIGRLAGGIAHDFNNLLTVISGYTNLLTDSLEGNSGAQGDLGEIRNAIKRAAALTGRLLAFSRKQVLQPAVLDMNKVIGGSMTLLRPLIGEDIELAVSLAREPALVKADPYQIEQVIVNLAVNARDAMPHGGRLSISAEVSTGRGSGPGTRPGTWVVLTVTDSGTGMSDKVKEHLFEPFFTTKENGKGTGLGLSTVYGIVTQTGGHIEVKSAPNMGSSFAVSLPLARAGAEHASAEESPAARTSGSGTVLVVEDEQTVRELARRVLEQGGYRVLTASSPQEALHIAEGMTRLDLLLTDVVMPGGMNGIQLGRELVRGLPGLAVLHMSGYTNEEAMRMGMSDRRLDFLAKPFHPGDLLHRVGELLAGQAAGLIAEPIPMGDRGRPLLSRALLALLAGMILANLGGAMFYPFFAIFLKSLGFPVETIGLYFTLASILPLLFQVIGGWISDRIGRVRSIAFGSIAGSVGWVAVVLAPSMAAPLVWLLASEAFSAVTRSLVGPSFDAFVAEQSSAEKRARVFAVVQALFMVVEIAGPPLGGLIAERLSFGALLWAAGGLYWAATAVRVTMALRAKRAAGRLDRSASRAAVGEASPRQGFGRSLALMGGLAVSGGLFTWILLVDGALDISGRINDSFLPLFLKEVGGLTESRIGLLRGFSAVCTSAAMVPMGWLADHKGERYPIVLGCALVGASAAIFAFGRGMLPFAAAFAVLGISASCFMPSLQSLVSKSVPERLRGMAFGFLSSSLGVFSFFAPAVGGILWKRYFPALPLLVSGALVVLAIVPAWIAFRRPPGQPAASADDLSGGR